MHPLRHTWYTLGHLRSRYQEGRSHEYGVLTGGEHIDASTAWAIPAATRARQAHASQEDNMRGAMRVNWRAAAYRNYREYYAGYWPAVVKSLHLAHDGDTEYGYGKVEQMLWQEASRLRADVISYGGRRPRRYYQVLAMEETLVMAILAYKLHQQEAV